MCNLPIGISSSQYYQEVQLSLEQQGISYFNFSNNNYYYFTICTFYIFSIYLICSILQVNCYTSICFMYTNKLLYPILYLLLPYFLYTYLFLSFIIIYVYQLYYYYSFFIYYLYAFYININIIVCSVYYYQYITYISKFSKKF